MGVILFLQLNELGFYSGHISLFCLMLSLVARPIKFYWQFPLKHRRTIGIIAFVAGITHCLLANSEAINFKQLVLFKPFWQNWGIALGAVSLSLMIPAAITSFKFWQRKLGKVWWRKLHLLTVPALPLAIFHTVLVGPHYLNNFFNAFVLVLMGTLVLFIRKKC